MAQALLWNRCMRAWSAAVLAVRVVSFALALALIGCSARGSEERCELPANDPAIAVTSESLSSIDCNEHGDTGYSQGNPFLITVVTVDGKPVEKDTANAYYVMAQAAANDGVNIQIVSGFRTMSEQQYLYSCYVNCSCNNCNLAATPGYSNHQSGHALDLNTSSGGVYGWLEGHAGWFGFARTVPSEAWHWEWWGGGPGGGPCKSCIPESCNGVDDDCDGLVDEDLNQLCGSDVGVCEFGSQTCQSGAWGACTGGVSPSTEACNELDDDCDSETDESEVCELEEAWQAALFDPATSSDIDGDGRADACALSKNGLECLMASGSGFDEALAVNVPDADLASPSVFSTLRTGDVTGDGRAEVCLRTTSGIVCFVGTSHGLGKRFDGPHLGDAEGYTEARYFSSIRLADVTGDGRLDLCVRSSDGLKCHPSKGKGFGAPRLLPALSDAHGFDDVNRFGTLRFGDIDGDGRVDVCARGAEGMSCWRANDNGFTERVTGPAWTDAAGFGSWLSWSTIRLADIDGDGRADLCAREAEAFVCYLFDGSGFSQKIVGPALTDADGWSLRQHFGTLRLGDIDGDGRSDLCAKGEAGVSCWLFGPSAFDRKVQGPALTDADGWALPEHYRTLRLADVDGDRRLDVCARGDAGFACWLSQSGGFSHSIAGPAWNDSAGFGLGMHYHTIRLAGGGVATNAPDESEADAAAKDDGGCGCRVGRRNPGDAALVALLALVVLAGRRRRAQRACASACR